jgi:hypothetical protein
MYIMPVLSDAILGTQVNMMIHYRRGTVASYGFEGSERAIQLWKWCTGKSTSLLPTWIY